MMIPEIHLHKSCKQVKPCCAGKKSLFERESSISVLQTDGLLHQDILLKDSTQDSQLLLQSHQGCLIALI